MFKDENNEDKYITIILQRGYGVGYNTDICSLLDPNNQKCPAGSQMRWHASQHTTRSDVSLKGLISPRCPI